MSRIGKRLIAIPPKVEVKINGSHIAVKGPKGELSRILPTLIQVEQENGTLRIVRADESRTARERHGLCRTLVSNMVEGVAQGFQKRLEIQGVGYRAQAQGSKLTLNLGYSKPVEMEMPQGIQVKVDKNVEITIEGIDKELVGNVAAQIRAARPPEPYKGKGVRYQGEMVRRKAGKTGGKGKK